VHIFRVIGRTRPVVLAPLRWRPIFAKGFVHGRARQKLCRRRAAAGEKHGTGEDRKSHWSPPWVWLLAEAPRAHRKCGAPQKSRSLMSGGRAPTAYQSAERGARVSVPALPGGAGAPLALVDQDLVAAGTGASQRVRPIFWTPAWRGCTPLAAPRPRGPRRV